MVNAHRKAKRPPVPNDMSIKQAWAKVWLRVQSLPHIQVSDDIGH